MSETDMLSALFEFGGFFIVIVGGCLIVSYILTSLSYKKVFEAYNYKNPVYAFIPFYNLYILADLTCDSIFLLGDIKIEKKIFVWWWLINYVIGFIPAIGGFFKFVINLICKGYCHDKAIKKVNPNHDAQVLSYLSSFIPIIFWILVLPKKTND